MSPIEESTWRNRFILMNLSRIAFTVLALLGLLVWQSDAIVEPTIIGLPIALVGVVGSFVAPKWLARRWRTPPEQ